MLMSNMKTVGIFVVIFCCFAVLYPKIFHPMVVHIFGSNTPKQKNQAPRHPREMNPNQPMPHPPKNPTMRAGVHPGMRHAAEMRKQAGDQGGGNKGMINMVLPMYAVGIVIYLVYTMAKVFMRNNKDETKPGPFQSKSEFYRSQSYKTAGAYYNYNSENLDEETRFLLSKREKLEELESLLAKAELKQINDNEMVTLRERLEETESQMSRILKAMEVVQTRVKDGIDATLDARGVPVPGGDQAGTSQAGTSQAGASQAGTSQAGQPKPDTEVPIPAEEAPETRTAVPHTDLDALDSETSGSDSDDELSEEEEDDDEDMDDEESDNDELDEEAAYETRERLMKGLERLDDDPNETDIVQHFTRTYDAIPDSDDSGDVMRGDVINDIDTGSDAEIDDVIETLGSSNLDLMNDSDGEMDVSGLRQRKNVFS